MLHALPSTFCWTKTRCANDQFHTQIHADLADFALEDIDMNNLDNLEAILHANVVVDDKKDKKQGMSSLL